MRIDIWEVLLYDKFMNRLWKLEVTDEKYINCN